MMASRYYLRQVYAERYGAFSKQELGPLKPGLNVVFGPNEAGKSTFSSLVKGVLFGWEDAHGVRNTYQPAAGSRSGMLTFAKDSKETNASSDVTESALIRITRVGDEPPRGERSSAITEDIDEATYNAIFSFSSNELRSLEDSSDVAAHLLAAESGTATSPSSAYLELEQSIAAMTSLSPDATDSVIVLAQQLEDKRLQVQEAARHVERLKQNDRELRELRSNHDDAHMHLMELDHAIDLLSKAQVDIEQIDARLHELKNEQEDATAEREQLGQQLSESASIDERLIELDANEIRILRDKLDEFEDLREKVTRIEDVAKENSVASTAGYEAIVELDGLNQDEDERAHERHRRTVRTIASTIPCIVFFLAGVILFIYGRRIGSLSFTVLSLGLIVLAFILGIATTVSSKRSASSDGDRKDRVKDAQWVMLQDKKRWDSSHAETEALNDRIKTFMEGAGLAQAQGSIKQARILLDDAQEARATRMQMKQRDAALELRIDDIKQEVRQLEGQRVQWEERLQVQPGVSLAELDELLQAKIAQRSALRSVSDETSRRIGQLSQELAAANEDTTFDQLKLEAEIVRTRLREGKEKLAELLLARRMLERAMISWEGNNQPLVYDLASRFLALMTDGRWVEVSISSTGSIVAINSKGEEVKPRHLSLGTCQQLYLSLRSALLLSALDVGRSVPVMADDILVHFDAQRRVGSARILTELAQSRQVVVFTCHQETVDALRAASSSCGIELNVLTLDRS